MVVACEALKPPTSGFREHKIFDVVESLIGHEVSSKLKQVSLRPQSVRGTHLHTGEFYGSEFLLQSMGRSFEDPTFREISGTLYKVTQAAIVEWLNRGGRSGLISAKRTRSIRSKLKEHALILALASFVAGIGLGFLARRLL